MFLESCLECLRETVPPAAIAQRVLKITGLTESAVEEIAAPIYTRYTNPVTTILAAPGDVQLHVKSFAGKQPAADALADELATQLERALGEAVYSNDGAGMEQVAGRLLGAAGATLGVAESCTGGMLAQRITAVPGSSAYFLGGVVCYSNAVKESWLGVPPEMLAAHGAVSAEVAQALAEGIRSRLQSTYGLGITGIAGPDGGTKDKSVGLVYVSLAAPQGTQVQEKRYWGERDIVRWQASQTALDLVRRALKRSFRSADSQH
jgi:nicotinamide-nucleotide amidase